MKIIKVVKKSDGNLFEVSRIKELIQEQQLVSALRNAPHLNRIGIDSSGKGIWADFLIGKLLLLLFSGVHENGDLSWEFYIEKKPSGDIIEHQDGVEKIKSESDFYPAYKSLFVKVSQYLEAVSKKYLEQLKKKREQLKAPLNRAFKAACFAAGIKTPNGTNGFKKAFTNLSKRAPGPRGGSRYNLKEWPTIRIYLDADKIKANTQLENISDLTGYQPDKDAGYDVKFPELKGVKVTTENIESVIKNYVDKVLSQWNALPGHK
jgi:hypothetical protein